MNLSQQLLCIGCGFAMLWLAAAKNASAQSESSTPDRVSQVPDESVHVTLTGNVHPLARSEYSHGTVADSMPMERILLLLKRSDTQEMALQSLLESQQDKSSPNYHKWVTPQEFGNRFGPSDADVRAVTDWLAKNGFRSVRVASGKSVIEFSGNAGQIRLAFATQIQNFDVNGSMYVANATDPQIPEALAPVVTGVVSLHNFPRKSHLRYLGDVQRNPASHKLEPLFTFPNPYGSGTFYGVGPGDFATIYNTQPLLTSGNDGTGQTIAIVGETEINAQDVGDFRTMFGLANNFPASNIIVNGADPGITSQDEESESDLDVQWSGAVAPGATVKFVVSASTPASSGIDLSALYIVEKNLADVMSESYGECEKFLGSAGNAFYNHLWEQAAAQGITVVVSAGDGGSAGCDNFNTQTTATQGLAVSGIAGTPFNVSVGGTDFNQYNLSSTYWSTTNDAVTGTSAKGYIPEFPWNQNCSQLGLSGCGPTAPNGSVNIVAGGGGASNVYGKPIWQMGVTGVPNDNHRDQPDVALFAGAGFSGSGYLFCQADLTGVPTCNLSSAGYTFHVIGGTSASAPAFAGIMALVNQYAAAHGGTSRQGNANFTLYALAKKSGASCTSSASESAGCVFNDIVTGNIRFPSSVGSNSVACKGGTPNCNATLASATGVLVDPNHATTEAWTTQTGYDLTTGLGSLNGHNLAAAWASVSTIGTTTTLSLSPTTGITHGQNENVAVTVNVKANTGTAIPSGDVALLATLADGSTLGVDQFTLANGALTSAKTQNLPGGTYNVRAHYAGDGTNAPSDSPAVQVSVGREASQTFIVVPTFDSQGNQTNPNATSVTYGSNYIIRIYATSSSALPSATGPPSPTCYEVDKFTCPTGNVSLTSSGANVDGGNFSLNNAGYTRDIAPTLTGGTYSLLAQYSGDNSYQASTSATHIFTVTPAPSSTSILSAYSPTLVGQGAPIIVETAVNVPGGVAPTGTFSYFDGGSPLAGTPFTPSSSSGGFIQGGISASFNTVGKHSITATYNGDANYAPSTTSSPAIVYAQYPTVLSITTDSTSIVYGKSVNITATVTASHTNPPFAGSLTIYNPFGGSVGPVTITSSTDGSGNQIMKAVCAYTPLESGYIQANFGGDNNYQSNSNIVDINVTVPDFTLSPANGVIVVPLAGQSGSGQITITPQSNMASSVALSFSPVVISGYTISLSPQQVNLNGAASSATLSMTTSVTVPTNVIKSQERRVSLVGFPRSGWWALSLATGLSALLLLAIPGSSKRGRLAFCSFALCLLCFAPGCGGGGGTTAPPGGGSPPVPTTIALSTSNAKLPAGAPFLVTATVASTKPLTGTVTFYNFGTPLAGGVIVNGQAQTGQGYINNPGVYQITATYSGDAQNLASTSAPLVQVLTGTFPVTIQGATGNDVHSLQATVGVQ